MTTNVSYDELVRLLKAVFLNHACSEQVATLLAENMAGAERDGALSHGIFRIKGNLGSLNSGWVDGKAVPVLEDVAPGMLRADGRNGFSLPVIAMAREPLMQKARTNGIAMLSCLARYRALRPRGFHRARHDQLHGQRRAAWWPSQSLRHQPLRLRRPARGP